jgi:hypothetical protein
MSRGLSLLLVLEFDNHKHSHGLHPLDPLQLLIVINHIGLGHFPEMNSHRNLPKELDGLGFQSNRQHTRE